jgi:hypothetical protein
MSKDLLVGGPGLNAGGVQDERGGTSRQAMQSIEERLERTPLLPKWDILIRPV